MSDPVAEFARAVLEIDPSTESYDREGMADVQQKAVLAWIDGLTDAQVDKVGMTIGELADRCLPDSQFIPAVRAALRELTDPTGSGSSVAQDGGGV